MPRLLFACLLLAACGDRGPINHADLALRIRAPGEIELGRGFALEVTRIWSKTAPPAPWSDAELAPLTVRHLGTERREDDTHVEETRRYTAYAFSLEDVTVRDHELRVTTALDPAAPGAAELPGRLAQPFTWLWWTLGGLAVIAAASITMRRRKSAPPPTAPIVDSPAPPPPHARALKRLERLRAQQPTTPDEVETYYREATGLLRDYTGERFGLPADTMTGRELAAAQPGLAGVFDHALLVRFARHTPLRPERESMLDGAQRYVEETA